MNQKRRKPFIQTCNWCAFYKSENTESGKVKHICCFFAEDIFTMSYNNYSTHKIPKYCPAKNKIEKPHHYDIS